MLIILLQFYLDLIVLHLTMLSLILLFQPITVNDSVQYLSCLLSLNLNYGIDSTIGYWTNDQKSSSCLTILLVYYGSLASG